MTSCKPFIVLAACLLIQTAEAGELQSHEAIVAAVERYVQQNAANTGAEINVTVSPLDQRLRLGKCNNLETWLPSGNKLWGRASIGVRCRAPSSWSIYVPIMIRVSGNAVVATHPIARGQAITQDDLELQTRDLTQYPNGTFSNPEQIIGRTATLNIPAGEVLHPEQLKAALVIRQGQQVTLVAQGAGFKVSSEGTAMGNAATGQVVAVKTRSGQIIKGIAKGDGVVEVYF